MADKREQCKSCKMGCTDSIYKIKLNTARIPFDKCLDFTPKQTNADRIRAMNDEELAEFLYGLDHYWDDGQCILRINDNHLNDYKDDILEWLQSEAE